METAVISFKNLSIAAALGSLAVLAVQVMLAATPGSACRLTLIAENSEEEVPGTVSADGTKCVPNEPFTGELAAANVGVPCGGSITVSEFEIVSQC